MKLHIHDQSGYLDDKGDFIEPMYKKNWKASVVFVGHSRLITVESASAKSQQEKYEQLPALEIVTTNGRSIVRNQNDVGAKYVHHPVFPNELEVIGLIDQTLDGIFAGNTVSLDQILDQPTDIRSPKESEENNSSRQTWQFHATTPSGGRGPEFSVALTNGDNPVIASVTMKVFKSQKENTLSMKQTLRGQEWQRVNNRLIPTIATLDRVHHSDTSKPLRYIRKVKVISSKSIPSQRAGNIIDASWRLRPGEILIDKSLALKITGDSRVFSIDDVNYLAPEPLSRHAEENLLQLIESSEIIQSSPAGPIQQE